MSVENVEKLIKDNQIEFVDLRFVDMRGVEQHVTFPVSIVEPSLFEEGKMFDGSSIAGWKGINESDMVLLPDTASAYVDPFYADPTIVISCDILDPATMQPYGRCPRGIAKRAEAYLKSSGIAETAFFGPEPEFFIFDSVRFANEMGNTFFKVDSEEAAWNSGAKYDGANSGYRPGVKGGYFPVPPTDTLHDLRGPLHALRLNLSSATHAPDGTDVSAKASEVEGTLSYLEQLVSQEMARHVDAPASPPPSQPTEEAPAVTEIATVLDGVADMFVAEAEDKGLSLRVIPTTARTSLAPFTLMRITSNLVSNAVRYTDAGRVVMGVRQGGAQGLRLEVHDTGSGMDGPTFARAMGRSERLGREGDGGHGLGLSIISQLAEENGLEVGLLPNRSTGTGIFVTLPKAT